ncbi:MAG: hypothetical protein FWG46_00335 [Treponema sp.]|nr:hypothetical protein [Treponema sp.]
MKKLVLIAAAALLLYSACSDVFFPEPVMPDSAFGRGEVPPNNVTASHGERRTITLSWDSAPGAAMYYIFKADSPLMDFIRCAETDRTDFSFAVEPGKTVYYRVASIFPNGNMSRQSSYTVGTSLAQPLISDITETTNESDELVWTVYWYMGNDSAYKETLMYTVYCFFGGTEIAQVTIDGSALSENKAEFYKLSPNINYTYQVEAYLSGNPGASERSQILDAETARRLTPDAPVNLRASHGISGTEIEITFELPERVDVITGVNPETGENEFESRPLYFVISKRIYTESGTYDYHEICLYFGLGNSDTFAGITGNKATFDEYVVGKTVSWTDKHSYPNNIIRRNVDYEYRVQSFVDETDRRITSTRSISSAAGWAVREGDLRVSAPDYLPNPLPEDADEFESASLELLFIFDTKGEEYLYKVMETIEQITDYNYTTGLVIDPPHPNSQDEEQIIWESGFLTFEEVNQFSREMDFNGKTTESHHGRGIYSYKVKIYLPDEDTLVDTVSAIGDWQISEDTSPFAIDEFYVRDGYVGQFSFQWKIHPGHEDALHHIPEIKYRLYEAGEDHVWNEIPGSYDAVKTHINDATLGWVWKLPDPELNHGVTKYFGIQPVMEIDNTAFGSPVREIIGHKIYAQDPYQTLGEPHLLNDTGISYSTVTLKWTEAAKADTYRIKYKYSAGADWIEADIVGKDDLEEAEAHLYKYPFQPLGYDDVTMAGKKIWLEVDALNEELRLSLEEETGGFVDEISLPSVPETGTENNARLIGPAELDAQASVADSANYIDVAWNEVPGATGYYVFRRQFVMDNSEALVTGNDARIQYYIPKNASSVTGKDLGDPGDTQTVKAAVTLTGSRYTLRDTYMADAEYDGEYRNHSPVYKNQQNELAWGYPYRYFIVPVISSSDYVNFTYGRSVNNKDADIASYTVPGVTYAAGADSLEKPGYAIGFGQNVAATKGGGGDKVNISWDPPQHLVGKAGFTPNYTLYRKNYSIPDTSSWSTVSTNTSVMYSDSPPTMGEVYDYVVGISNGGGSALSPGNFRRYIAMCRTLYQSEESEDRGWYDMMGYILTYARVTGASRDERASPRDTPAKREFGELVQWHDVTVGNNISDDLHWGIDGYSVWVWNRNHGKSWRRVHSIPLASGNIDLEHHEQEAFVDNTSAMNGDPDPLKVLRDYKHFFCVRPYVLTSDGEVYGPAPAFSEQETDYVKWGARQIDVVEFTKIASLHITLGLNLVVGSGNNDTDDVRGWDVSYNFLTGGDDKPATGTNGSGSVSYTAPQFSFGSQVNWTYSTYKPSLLTLSGDRVSFLTLNGGFGLHRGTWLSTVMSVAPVTYGNDAASQSPINCVGPSDVAMYSGSIRFINLTNSGGYMNVEYPLSSSLVRVTDANANTPLPFDERTMVIVAGHPWVHARLDMWK